MSNGDKSLGPGQPTVEGGQSRDSGPHIALSQLVTALLSPLAAAATTALLALLGALAIVASAIFSRGGIADLGPVLVLAVMAIFATWELIASRLVRAVPTLQPTGSNQLADSAYGRLLHPSTVRRNRSLLILSLVLTTSLYCYRESLGALYSKSFVDSDVESLLFGRSWITYDPLGFDPSSPVLASERAMDTELASIRRAGYGGVITFASKDTRSQIPRLARKHSLSVIQGIWDPTDEEEVRLAVSLRKYVDAYTIGHDGLRTRYSYSELARTIDNVRFRTRRPVSTTEPLQTYLEDERIRRVGDWIFPDAHLAIKNPSPSSSAQFLADSLRDAQLVFDVARRIFAAAPSTPIMLKMVTYPDSGIPGASEVEQARFFATLLEGRRDAVSDLPRPIAVSVHSAFDQPWKTGRPFYEWDKHTGLLDDDGTPRPATSDIVSRIP